MKMRLFGTGTSETHKSVENGLEIGGRLKSTSACWQHHTELHLSVIQSHLRFALSRKNHHPLGARHSQFNAYAVRHIASRYQYIQVV